MQEDRSVLVLGVGPEEGLGVALCKAFAAEGYLSLDAARKKIWMFKKIKTDKGKTLVLLVM